LTELLEKSRSKRPSIEDVLKHPWFGSYKEIQLMRSDLTDTQSKFEAFSMVEPNSPKIAKEVE